MVSEKNLEVYFLLQVQQSNNRPCLFIYRQMKLHPFFTTSKLRSSKQTIKALVAYEETLRAWDSCDVLANYPDRDRWIGKRQSVGVLQCLLDIQVEYGIFPNAQVYLRPRFLYSEFDICAMYDSRETSKHDRGPCEQLQLH